MDPPSVYLNRSTLYFFCQTSESTTVNEPPLYLLRPLLMLQLRCRPIMRLLIVWQLDVPRLVQPLRTIPPFLHQLLLVTPTRNPELHSSPFWLIEPILTGFCISLLLLSFCNVTVESPIESALWMGTRLRSCPSGLTGIITTTVPALLESRVILRYCLSIYETYSLAPSAVRMASSATELATIFLTAVFDLGVHRYLHPIWQLALVRSPANNPTLRYNFAWPLLLNMNRSMLPRYLPSMMTWWLRWTPLRQSRFRMQLSLMPLQSMNRKFKDAFNQIHINQMLMIPS